VTASAHRHPNESRSDQPPSGSSLIANSLNADRLSVWHVVFFTLSAATPLTVVSGVVPTGYGVTGVLGIPLAFLLVGVILWVFTGGFVAMGRSISNAGAFYAYVAQGLSRRVAVGVAWLALTSYNLLQVGLYGIIGVAAGPLAEQYFSIDAPWWAFALVAWAVTAALGLMKVDLNGRVLSALLLTEVAVIVVFSIANIADPGPEGVSFATLEPSSLSGLGWGSLFILGLAVLGYVGFESAAVYSEETRNTARTVKAAMYWTVGGSCLVYVLASWGMSVAVGPAKIVQASQEQGAELFFTLASDRLGSVAMDIGHILLLTSITAALISFHNTVARYAFALGREHVMPEALGRTSASTGSPVVASAAQSAIGLLVIIVFAAAGLDPLLQLFYVCGTAGGIGVLSLLLITAIAIVSFFLRNPHSESAASAFVAPALATLLLAVVLLVSLIHLDSLLGVRPGHPLTVIIPIAIVAILGLGALWGNFLRSNRPQVFELIGQGADSARARVQLVNR
jgi:amino acid transporter